jgi:hypothetical protein
MVMVGLESEISVIVAGRVLSETPDVAVEDATRNNDDNLLLNVSPLGSSLYSGPAMAGEYNS